jgi:hypothetical protein
MSGVGQNMMFEIQILVLVVVRMRAQTLSEKLDDTGELPSFGGTNFLKPNIENGLIENNSNVKHIQNPEEYNTNPRTFKEEYTKKIMHKFDMLENIQKTTEKENIVSKNNKTRNSQENSFPEILIMSFIGIFVFIILLLLCLGSKNWVKRFITGRQRLKKALKYRPSKYRTRVTPIPGEQIETVGDEMKTPIQGIFQIS